MAVVDEPHARHLRLIVVPMGRCPNGDSSKPHLTHLELANSAIPFRMASEKPPAPPRRPYQLADQLTPPPPPGTIQGATAWAGGAASSPDSRPIASITTPESVTAPPAAVRISTVV